MTFEDIFKAWEVDSFVDKTELSDESLKIPKLHHKYSLMFYTERTILRNLEAEYKTLKFNKTDFFANGPDEETIKLNWKLPPKGRILKVEIQSYVESDQDIINLSLKIGLQQDKVDFIDSIIKTINHRGYIIRNAIDFEKWIGGN